MGKRKIDVTCCRDCPMLYQSVYRMGGSDGDSKALVDYGCRDPNRWTSEERDAFDGYCVGWFQIAESQFVSWPPDKTKPPEALLPEGKPRGCLLESIEYTLKGERNEGL